MHNRIYMGSVVWITLVVLLSNIYETGAIKISDESTTVMLTTSTATAYPNTTIFNKITSVIINTSSTPSPTSNTINETTTVVDSSTTPTSLDTITIKESFTKIIYNSTTSTSDTTTVKESLVEVINDTTTSSPVTTATTIIESTTSVMDNTSTSTSPKATTAITPRVPQWHSRHRVFLCQCGSGEAMNQTGQCQTLDGGTTVPAEDQLQGVHHTSIADYNVIIYKPNCTHHQINLQDGEFMLRRRGDLLVFAGNFSGFRVADYCIHHELVEGRVEVSARGCVPQPVIPRCCPSGEHMENGECVTTSNIAKPFDPYLGTAPFDDTELAGVPYPWDDHNGKIEKPKCVPGKNIKKFELNGNKTYLAVASEKVLLTFIPDNGQRQYKNSREYCVDVSEDSNKYYAYSCERDPGWDPDVYCNGKVCVNKCCPEGQALSLAHRSCVPNNKTFKPPFTSSPSSFETLYGWPKCGDITNIGNFKLLQDGTLSHRGNTYPLSKFCLDNVINDDSISIQGLGCIDDIQVTTWHVVRNIIFPVCIVLSCVALVLLILLHIWIPKLREKEGRYQLFHAASLLLAYSVTLSVQILVPMGYVMGDTCVALAFVMQFAFLSAFFWLNTMCFDIWRLFRNLVRSMYVAHITVSIWKYLVYALGGPLIITVITILIQYLAPKDGSVPGLVHPHIGEGRCWFRSGTELLVYFYGPIAVLFLLNFIFIGLTYHYLKIIRGDYKTENDPSEYTINSRETTRKYDFFSAFWQRFYLLVFVAMCWLTEILSWLIHPEELWALTDILNNLQGVFVFFIFLSHHKKRALLKDKLPKLFKFGDKCVNHAIAAQISINDSTKKLSRKISTSTILSNVSSFSTFSTRSVSTSSSSFSLSNNEPCKHSFSIGIRSLSLTRKVSKPLGNNNSPGTPLSEIDQNHV